MIHGRVLITGGSGFLGRGILRAAKRDKWNAEFTILSRDEYKQDLLRRKYKDVRCILGDVTDYDRLASAMWNIDVVIHAAAIKYIPEAEFNVDECIKVNVDGSRNVLKAASNAGVSQVVCISTDKAASPINVYGMTKALMERLAGEYARLNTHSTFTCVRYGNVVGSTGSVIPLFERQLAENGRITITDPDMTRFWISIDRAVELINIATDVHSGFTVIPKASSMQLMQLAHCIAGDAPIEVLGQRPGEKRHEMLINAEESVRAMSCGSYYQIAPIGTHPLGESFQSISSFPQHWVSEEEMSKLIQDAKCV